ncbi:hypothetical protein O0I10_008060 [Lichtheimia ornata]|uniref:Uncharacterized protein n=1 Tax=Lichtheimia ornata TaxID=688661 RepID=A0AAD7V0H7_9FUNG|nr:uncharacterized protein O0I10_008060 [Lichtheimia ornata]KAJ8656266.1 hypothetical protein O0I10_008060 [Lichtheimia ornata]
MAPLPPIYRTFVQPETLPEKKSYPAPEGVSHVTTTIYSKYAVFIEQDDRRGLIPVHKLEKAIAKALTKFYLFAGRLSPEPRGRFSIQDFDKGCLFQVCELPDSFEEYKKNRFGYTTVPVDELMPIHRYASFDTPLVGVQLTQLQGGQALAYSISHRLADGVIFARFMSAVAYALRNEEVPPIEMYYDWQRPPLKTSPKYDHSIDYPVMKEKIPKPVMAMDPGPSMKRIIAITEDKAQELKRQMKQEMPNKEVKISVRDAITAFMYRTIVKARRLKGQCNLIYVVSTRNAHPDKRLQHYFGNYITPITVPGKHDELIHSPVVSTAQRIREHVNKVNPEYMDSLEHYLNNLEDPSKVLPPLSQMTSKDVMWSDGSRFVAGYDVGYGKHSSVARSWSNPMPVALVAMGPNYKGAFELMVQLDPESMERLMNDKQVQYYTLGAF